MRVRGSLEFRLSLYGDTLPVLSMHISSDGTLLVSGSADKNLEASGIDLLQAVVASKQAVVASKQAVVACKQAVVACKQAVVASKQAVVASKL